jgi:NAD(P)-dependent dehydrogenase (short-subunit alcohol dehydrogenase family)
MSTEAAAALRGKRILVSGGTRGMGAAAAGLLGQLGARVIVAARTAPDDAGPRPDDAGPRPVDAGPRPVVADAATPGGARAIAGAVTRELGGVDVIVHCVGASFAKPGGTLALSDADWDAALATNLLSAVRIDRELLPPTVPRRRPWSATARCSPRSSRPAASGSMS